MASEQLEKMEYQKTKYFGLNFNGVIILQYYILKNNGIGFISSISKYFKSNLKA